MPEQTKKINVLTGGKSPAIGNTVPADDLREKLKAVIKAEGLTQRQVSAECSINSGRLSSYLGGKYTGNNNEIRAAIRQWFAYREAKRETQSFAFNRHVAELANTQKIDAVLQHSQTAAEMACLYGAAGGGKTHAALQYAKRYPNVFMITAEPAMCSLSAVLREIAAAVKVSESTCSIMSRDIAAALVGKKALLIIDESHHLSQRIFDQLRCIYDKINQSSNDFGLAFLGNEPLFQRLTAGPMMKQIFSRLGYFEELTAPPEADGSRLLAAIIGKETTARGALWAGEVIGGVGGIRAVLKAARRAVLATGKPLDKLTESDILSANR